MANARILHLMDKLSVQGSKMHGPARQVSYRVPGYDPRRYEVLVCNMRAEGTPDAELRERGVQVVSLGRGKFDPRTLADLVRLIRRWNPDLLHLSGYAAWTFGRIAGRLCRVPVVVQEHFVDPRVPVYQRLTDWCLRRFQDRAIAVSDSVKTFMIQKRYLRETDIEVIGNGVPVDRLRHGLPDEAREIRQRLGLAPEAKVVGIVGRLAEMKGHTYFLQAAQRIAARIKDAAFVIVGEGPLGPALRRQVEQLGLTGRVHFVGYQAEVLPYLSMFDVTVIPSIYGEGFCSVGLESFLAETPVVMTEIVAAAGPYAHRKNVLRVPTHDAETLAGSVIELLTRPELGRELVRQGALALESCTIQESAARYLACYDRTVRRNGSAPRAPQAAPRICFLNEAFHPIVGGGETYTRNISRRLAGTGVPVLVLTRRVLRELPRTEELDGVRVHRLPPSGLPRFGKYLMVPFAVAALIRFRSSYDVIFVSNFRILGPVAVVMARLLGKRCVLRAGICGEFSGQYVADNGGVSTRTLSWLSAPLAIRRAVLRRADGFVSNCQAISDEFRAGGAPERKIVLMPGGVDTDVFHPVSAETRDRLRVKLALPRERFLVGYSGKLSRGKGVNHLVAALPAILQHHPEVHLVLIGSGQHQFLSQEDEIKTQVHALSLGSHVTCTGYVDNVADYLQSLDAFAFPTEHEALPNALLEAMACGLPCVASRVGGIPDMIEDGVSGVLTAPADVVALEHAIKAFKADPAFAGRLSVGARHAMKARYSVKVLAKRHADFFAGVANGGVGVSTHGTGAGG